MTVREAIAVSIISILTWTLIRRTPSLKATVMKGR
jgi:hypothetical protein